MLHFLPFKANRDELFKAEEDTPRLAPLYSKTTPPSDKNVKQQFTTLKSYMETYRTKHGKTKVEEIKQQEPPAQSVSTQATEKIDGQDYEIYGEWQIIDNYDEEYGESARAQTVPQIPNSQLQH